MGSGRLRSPDDGSQILGILDPVQDDEEGRLGCLQGPRNDLLGLDVREWPGLRQDPLVGPSRDEPIQVGSRPDLDRHSPIPAQPEDGFDASPVFLARQIDPVDGPPARAQRLQDGMRTRQDLGPGRCGRATRGSLHSLTRVTATAGSRSASANSDTAWVAALVSSSRKPCAISACRITSAAAQVLAFRAVSRCARSS